MKHLWLCLLFPLTLFAQKVTLTWDSNVEIDLAGYRVYYGNESGNYHTSVDVGLVVEYQMSGLEVGASYYFVLTAYDLSDNESPFSDEAGVIINDTGAPQKLPIRLSFTNFTEVNIKITADNEYQLYINGSLLGNDNRWQNAETYTIFVDANNPIVIAVRCTNIGEEGGFLAEVVCRDIHYSSSMWRVKDNFELGWNERNFDDSHWTFATDYGPYQTDPWWKFGGVSGFDQSSQARWIWGGPTQDDAALIQYFRLKIL